MRTDINTGTVKIAVQVEAPRAVMRYRAPVTVFTRQGVTRDEAEGLMREWVVANPKLQLVGTWQAFPEFLS